MNKIAHISVRDIHTIDFVQNNRVSIFFSWINVRINVELTKYGRSCHVPRAPVGTRSPETPQNFGHGPRFVGQLLSRNKVSQKMMVTPPPPLIE